jgi:hypothetical protein
MYNVTWWHVRITSFSGNAIRIKYYECVCIPALVIGHAKLHLSCVLLSSVACLPLPYFTTLPHKRHDFHANIVEQRRVFWFSLQFLSKAFLILWTIQQDITNVRRSLHKVLWLLSDFNQTWNFFNRFSNNPHIKFHEDLSSGRCVIPRRQTWQS